MSFTAIESNKTMRCIVKLKLFIIGIALLTSGCMTAEHRPTTVVHKHSHHFLHWRHKHLHSHSNDNVHNHHGILDVENKDGNPSGIGGDD